MRRRALLEGLESRVLFANTLLYFDADGNTSAATGGTGTWNSSSLVWRLGSPTGTLQAWNNADPSTTTAVFGGTAGTVTIAAGTTIHVNAVQATTNVTLNGGDTLAALHLSGTTPAIGSGSMNVTVGANVTGSAGIVVSGTGNLTLSGANTFTGTIKANSGTLTLASAGAAGASTNPIHVGDSTAGQNAAVIFKASGTGWTVSNPINVQSGAGARTIGQAGPGSGTFTLNVAGLVTLANSLTITNTTAAANGQVQFTGGIAGTGNVTLSSTARPIYLSGSWSYSGSLTNAGTGNAVVTANLPASITSITQSGAGALSIGGTSSYAGSYNVSAGTLAPASATGFTASNVINLGAGATLNLKNPSGSSSQHFNVTVAGVTGAGTVTNSATTLRTLTVAGAGSYTFDGVISGTYVALTRSGTGFLTLTGASNFAGATTVSGGKLTVNGSVAGSAISLTGAVLAGSGTLGAVNATSGTIDAGNSNAGTGVLNTGNLTLGASATLRAQINGSVIGDAFDQVNVTGTVNLGGAALSLSGTRAASEGHQITLIRNDGADAVVGTFAGRAEGSTLTVNGVTYKISYVGGTGNDVVLTDMTTGALSNDSPFGVSIDSTRGKQFSSWVPQMATAGSRWVRGLPVGWGVVEGTQGTFNFSVPDAQLAVANTNNTYLIGTLINAPAWTGEAGSFPVNHLPEWSNYVTQVVTHYSPTVKYWEVWNEPPHYSNNGTAAQYAQLVAASYDAAKAVDSTAQVGIAGSSVNIAFIKQAIQAGAAGKYDYITLHPYEMLGTLDQNWEVQYMSMVSSVRKMLAEVDPTKVNVPIIFTEIGAIINAGTTADEQASLLVKSFSMNIAQGVRQTDWFEGRDGDSGAFGLLDSAGVARTAYTALTQMINYLGQYPQYLGWVKLNNNDWGFVFQGKTENVLVTWAPTGTTDTINLSSSATFVNPLTGTTTSGTSYSLTDTPVLVVGAPLDIVAQAKANRSSPLPWPVDYSGASSVAFTPNANPVETGLHVQGASTNFVTAYGETVYNAGNASATGFAVDPNFLSYDHTPITITVVARRKEANAAAGFNLKYESSTTTGYKNSSASWWSIPGNTQWYAKTYTISDPQFVGYWGYNFKLDSDTTGSSQYYIKSITITKSSSLLAKTGSSTTTTKSSKTIQYTDARPAPSTTLNSPSAFFSRSIASGLFSDDDITPSSLATLY